MNQQKKTTKKEQIITPMEKWKRELGLEVFLQQKQSKKKQNKQAVVIVKQRKEKATADVK